MIHQKLYLVYQYVSLALPLKGPLIKTTSCSMLFTDQEIKLTDITLYPRLDSVRICLKNTSAVPLAGGKHTRGQRTLRGPASYINHSFSSELSTTIYNGWKTDKCNYISLHTVLQNELNCEKWAHLSLGFLEIILFYFFQYYISS